MRHSTDICLAPRVWSLPLPPPMPGRYSPRHQFREAARANVAGNGLPNIPSKCSLASDRSPFRIAERVPCFAVKAGDLKQRAQCSWRRFARAGRADVTSPLTPLRPAHAACRYAPSSDGGIAMILRLPRWMRVLLTVGLIAGIAASVPAVREPVMRVLGSALIVEDPFEVVDVIVVSVDADGAGVLEAADLVERGVAKRVAIFAKPLKRSDQEFARRGLPAEDEATRQIRELASLGVTDVERILLSDAGTDGEALALPHWTAATASNPFW